MKRSQKHKLLQQ